MKRRNYKLFMMILTAGIICATNGISAKAEENQVIEESQAQELTIRDSGVYESEDCSITWSLDTNGTLTVEGTGNVPGYDSYRKCLGLLCFFFC